METNFNQQTSMWFRGMLKGYVRSQTVELASEEWVAADKLEKANRRAAPEQAPRRQIAHDLD